MLHLNILKVTTINPQRRVCVLASCLILLAIAPPTLGQSPESKAGSAAPASATPAGQNYRPLSPKEQWQYYVKDNYASPGAFFRSIWGAAVHQYGNDPPEWGQGMGGYGKRLGSQFAKRSIQGSIESAAAYGLGTDPRYLPCHCRGFFKRLGYAAASNFVTRTKRGSATFNAANVGAIYGASMISITWHPDRYSWKDGFREGSQRLVIGGSFNIFREFWPDIRKALPFKRKQ